MKYVTCYYPWQKEDETAAIILATEIDGQYIGRTIRGNAVIEFEKELGLTVREELNLWPLHPNDHWIPFV